MWKYDINEYIKEDIGVAQLKKMMEGELSHILWKVKDDICRDFDRL